MERGEALLLLREMEKIDGSSMDVNSEEFKWWRENFPETPDRILKRILGQGEAWDPGALPWNRHQRRAHEKRGVAIHLFSGPNVKKWRSSDVGGLEWVFIDTCLGSQYDLHRPVVWTYLWSLAQRGLIKLIVGGPPCRTVSRLRGGSPLTRAAQGTLEGSPRAWSPTCRTWRSYTS